MQHLRVALILLALFTLDRPLVAQMVRSTTGHDLFIPYVGLQYGFTTAGELNGVLANHGISPIDDRILTGTVGLAYVFHPTDSHASFPLSVALEYSGGRSPDDDRGETTQISFSDFNYLFGVPFVLGSRWSASVTIGAQLGFTTTRVFFPSTSFSSSSRDPQPLNSALANPGRASHEIEARDLRLLGQASLGYAIPISSDTLQTRFLGLHLRIGTELPISDRDWSVDGEAVEASPRAPYRPLHIDLLCSFFVRER